MASHLTASERNFQNAAEWALNNCTLTPFTNQGNPYGTTGPQCHLNAIATGNVNITLARFVPAKALAAHRAGVWKWGMDASISCLAGIDWYDSNHTYISTSSATTASTPASTWVPVAAGSPTAPSNAVWAKPWFQANAITAGNWVTFTWAAYAVVNPPWRMHNQPSDAWQARRARSSLLSLPGVRGDNELQVVERRAGRNLSVDVLPGSAYVQGSSITDQGSYYVESDSTVNLPLNENLASDWRVTSIFAKVNDSTFESFGGPPQPNSWGIVAIDGVAGSPYNPPATPVSALKLADVWVGPNSRAIVTGNIVDTRAKLQTQGAQIFTLDGSSVLLQANVGPWVLTNQRGWARGWAFIPYAAPFPNKTISITTTDTGPWNNDGLIRVLTLPGQGRSGFWVAVRYSNQPYLGWLYLRYVAIGM